MKHTILFCLTLLLSAVVQAAQPRVYSCIDAKTGVPAGQFQAALPVDGEGRIMYSNMNGASDGWVLAVTEDGEIYNADMMVKHGERFYVGSLQFEGFQLFLEINKRKLSCE
jgi:hypothetical protein